MSGLYEELCNLFIKPARQSYTDHDLGPIVIGKASIRENFQFTSHRGYEIKASFFKNTKGSNICIVYLHSFNGSRLESLRYASDIAHAGFHFCSFDFAGCGNSGGEYVTIGCHQRWDVLKLLQKLKIKYGIVEYFVWGRSMGAVTAIKFYSLLVQEQKNHRFDDFVILGLVLDSAFISLRRMVAQVGSHLSSMPEFLIKAAFLMVGSSIEQRAGFKIDQLDLEADVSTIRCSTLLIASSQDTFVHHAHSEDIFSSLKLINNKEILYTKGQHYEQRDQSILNSIYSFFLKNQKKYGQYLDSLKLSGHHRQAPSFQEHSIQKINKSLKKYQPKFNNSSKIIEKYQKKQEQLYQNGAKILFKPKIEEKQAQNITQFHTQKKNYNRQTQTLERQYQTQKRMPQHYRHNHQIIFQTNSHRELRNNDEIKSSNKPNIAFIGMTTKIQDNFHKHQKQAHLNSVGNPAQGSHCNLIADRLRKKAKIYHKEVYNFNSLNNQTNTENQQRNKRTAKISFNICSPSNPTQTKVFPTQCEPKKLSMTAQQYKNAQIKKSQAALSPHRVKQDKSNLSQLKFRPQNSKEGQARSMTNLFAGNMVAIKQTIKRASNGINPRQN